MSEIRLRLPVMDPASDTPTAIDFGRFRVLPHRRELLAEGQPVELAGRAFDVLMALIEARGAVVSKNALMECVWPDRIVGENSLQAQISALRRAFAADRGLIRTIAGRGYQFTGETRTVSVSATPDAQATAGMPQTTPTRPPTNLPEPVSELIGRDAELNEILGLSASEDHFRQALDWARRQGALTWELRAATSLARLLSDSGPFRRCNGSSRSTTGLPKVSTRSTSKWQKRFSTYSQNRPPCERAVLHPPVLGPRKARTRGLQCTPQEMKPRINRRAEER
jgi:DNA-binding winged helix-turn-helix (wHTH) protein